MQKLFALAMRFSGDIIIALQHHVFAACVVSQLRR
jgi:hypothetical protein